MSQGPGIPHDWNRLAAEAEHFHALEQQHNAVVEHHEAIVEALKAMPLHSHVVGCHNTPCRVCNWNEAFEAALKKVQELDPRRR